jgi:hypothetical protein
LICERSCRSFLGAVTRLGREPVELIEAKRGVVEDERAIDAYCGRRSCHPFLPLVDWNACAPALGRLGAVIVAGCRDAVAAAPARLHLVADDRDCPGAGPRPRRPTARVGFLLSPPDFPLRVSAAARDLDT